MPISLPLHFMFRSLHMLPAGHFCKFAYTQAAVVLKGPMLLLCICAELSMQPTGCISKCLIWLARCEPPRAQYQKGGCITGDDT